jgi:hypothetical protein
MIALAHPRRFLTTTPHSSLCSTEICLSCALNTSQFPQEAFRKLPGTLCKIASAFLC